MMCPAITIPFPYRTQAEIPATSFPDTRYHPEIPNPWGERVESVVGMWVENNRLVVSFLNAQWVWPGGEMYQFRVNATTGEQLRTATGAKDYGGRIGGLLTRRVQVGAGGELYAEEATGEVHTLGPYPDYVRGEKVLDPEDFDVASFSTGFILDKVRNTLVHTQFNEVYVASLSTKQRAKTFTLPTNVLWMVHEEGTRIYLLLDNGVLMGLDYNLGVVLSAIRLPLQSIAVTYTGLGIAWDKPRRRLLMCEVLSPNPDGSSRMTIKGFLMRPVPVHVLPPIPLKRLRVGQRTPVLVRAVGDLGEGIPTSVTLTGGSAAATIEQSSVPLDADGDGYALVRGVSTGNLNLTASLEVACQR